MKPRDYDSTVARIAGNIASGLASQGYDQNWTPREIAEWTVKVARAIVAETTRTEPTPEPDA